MSIRNNSRLFFYFIIMCLMCISIKSIAHGEELSNLQPPQNIKASTGKYIKQIRLYWDEPTNCKDVVGYKIIKNGIELTTVRRTGFIDKNVTWSGIYEYKVAAFDKHNNYSDYISIKVAFNDCIPPNSPQNLKIEELSQDSVVITWSNSFDNIETTGYIIFRDDKEIARVNESKYTDNNLQSNNAYIYTVKAFDSANNISKASKPLRVKTGSFNNVPNSYKNLNIVLASDFLSDTKVNLKWNIVGDKSQIKEYVVFRNGCEISRTQNEYYNDELLSPVTGYLYMIKAIDFSSNIITKSNEVSLVTYSENKANDNIENAVTVEQGEYTGHIDYEGDCDWYKINILNQCNLKLEIKDLPQNVQVNLLGYDSNNNELFSGSSKNGVASSEHNLQSGIYYIKVLGVKGHSLDNKYSLTISYTNTYSQFNYLKTNGGITLKWQALQDCVEYKVYSSMQRDSKYELLIQTKFNTCTDVNVISGKTYYYKIGYCKSNGSETFSDVLEVKSVDSDYSYGVIKQDTIWDSANGPYIVRRSLSINQNICLKIMPGTVVQFYPSTSVNIYGRLDAFGTSESKIIFTSIKDAEYGGDGVGLYKDNWKGLSIKDTGEICAENVVINYAGLYDGTSWSAINGQGKLILSNSIIKNSYCKGINMVSSTKITIKDCCFIDNKDGGIAITNNGSVNVIVENNKIINCKHGIMLTGDGATIITVKNNNISQCLLNGIMVDNRGSGKIHIENNTISDITYGFEIFNDKTAVSVFQNNTINNAKEAALKICCFGKGTLTIRNNNFDNCANPLYVVMNDISGTLTSLLDEVSNNTFLRCNNTVTILGTIKYNMTIPKPKYSYFNEYCLYLCLTVPQGITVFIEPGVVLKASANLCVEVNGTLNMLGTQQEKVILTSLNDVNYENTEFDNKIYYWKGIIVNETGELNVSNAIIKYAGYDNNYGIKVQGNLILNDSLLCNLGNTAIYFCSNIQPVIKNNTFLRCSSYAVFNVNSSVIIDASYNYWGSVYGPKVFNNEAKLWEGEGEKVSPKVIYWPWLGQEYISEVECQDGTNFATGSFSRSFTDMSFNCPSFEMDIGRVYSSTYILPKDSIKGLMGKGWRFNLEGSIYDYNNTGLKIVKLLNGSVELFNQNTDGTYIGNGTRSQLIKRPDGTYILTTKNQYSYGFNSKGYLCWIKDRNDNTITINIDDFGKVSSIVDTAGKSITITYNNDLISEITDSLNRKVRYEYENELLARVIDPNGNITRYSYDQNGFLSEIRDNNFNLIEAIMFNHQEGTDKVSQTTDKYGNVCLYIYDGINKKTTITDSNGRQTIQWYDGSMQPIKYQDAEGRFIIKKYFVDSFNVNKYGEEKSIIDRNGNNTQYERDNRGNITKIINPDASCKLFTYDQNNNLKMEKDELGKCTFYIYDAQMKNLIKKVQQLNGADLYTIGCDESKFAVTNYSYYTDLECIHLGYKVKGLVKTITDPEGNVIKYTYYPDGLIHTATNAENKVTTYEYNFIGWKTKEISPKGYVTQHFYNNNGKLEKTILDGGETSRMVYDILGRKTKEVSPNLYNLIYEKNNTYTADHGYRYIYYQNGEIQKMTDPEGNVTEFTYDIYGNKITETNQNRGVCKYEYDVMDRIIKVCFTDNAPLPILLEFYEYKILPDGKTQKVVNKYLNESDISTTIYTYDYANRLVEVKNADGSNTQMTYNANGTINTTTDANNSVTYYKYDQLNRLIQKWTPCEKSDSNIVYTCNLTEYDKAGRKITEKVSKDKIELYQVPLQNSMIVKTYQYYNDDTVKSVTDNEGRKVEYKYDDEGKLSQEDIYTDSASKSIIQYENNHLGKMSQKKVYIRKGDIFGNDYDDDQDMVITTSYTYDKNGNLNTQIRHDGVVITYSYDKLNRQTCITEPTKDEYDNDSTIKILKTYNYEGNPLTITDANGNVTKYEYNKRGLLEKLVDAKGGITAYKYDIGGRKVLEVLPQSYDSSKQLNSMDRTEYIYDVMNRVKAVKCIYTNNFTNQEVSYISKAYKYDNNGNVIKELDALGYLAGTGNTIDEKITYGYGTEHTCNLLGKVVSTIDPVNKDKGLAYTVKYGYDALGRKISETTAKGAVESYLFDNNNNLLKVFIQKNSKSSKQTLQINTYDYLNNIKSKTDGNENTVTFSYNTLNKLSKAVYPKDTTISSNIIIYQYDVCGNLKKQETNMGTVDLYTYDNQGRELSYTQQKQDGSESITTSVRYDKNGNKRFITDGNGTVTENVYDELNRVITSKIKVGGIEQSTSYTYDKNGNLIKATDWRGNCYKNTYDSLNRLVAKEDPNQVTIEKNVYNNNGAKIKTYDALDNLTQYTYDKNNRLLSTIDAEGHITSQIYDEIGNIAVVKDGNNNTTTYSYDEFNRLISVLNAKGETTSYTYDLNGNMLSLKDGRGNITTYTYNILNKISTQVDHNGKGVSSKTQMYIYYEDGSLKSKTDRSGKITTYTYDCHGRLISQSIGDITISYTYDSNNNKLSMLDKTGLTKYTYDELNRIKIKFMPNIDTTTYYYDIITNVPQGHIARKVIDPKGNITFTVYDKAGRLVKVEHNKQITTYNYYNDGSKKSIKYPNGTTTEYEYYKDKILHTLINKNSNQEVIDSYTYSYDSAHNITSKTDPKGTTSYVYDALNRLEKIIEPNGKTTEYIFDASGNRLSEKTTFEDNLTTKTYTYNEQNRLMKVTTWLSDVAVENRTYTYDNNGNQLTEVRTIYENKIPITTQTILSSYDELNQLISTTMPDGKLITNVYNGEGLRVEKSVDGNMQKYVYEQDKVILELDDKNNQTAVNVQGTNLISRIENGKVYNYLYNGHGDVVSLMDTDENVVSTYYYDAFGNLIESTGDINNSYTYAGYQYDSETKLYYLLARMYDPLTARFLQEDTYRGSNNDPLSLNLYTYCHNEPLMYVDTTGHWDKLVHEDKTISIAQKLNFSKKHSKIIGKADNAVDLTITTSPFNVNNESQGWHFDRNPDSRVDTRIEHSNACFNNAVKMWQEAEKEYKQNIEKLKGKKSDGIKKKYYANKREEKREQALEELGKGLHPLQDIDAHMYWGSDDYENPLGLKRVHKDSNDSSDTFDDPQYDFEVSGNMYIPIDRGSKFGSYRYARTYKKTNDYLNRFIKEVNYKK